MEPPVLALLVLFTPLAAATAITLFFRRQGTLAAALSVGAAGVAALLGGYLVLGGARFEASHVWMQLGSFELEFGLLFDDLAALLLLVVVGVGFLIHVFSLGYMRDDPSRGRFFAGMSFFMFAMIGLTMADDLVLLFVFWELVGLASYLLIGFYWDRPEAVAASKKAFITNRLGDFGFLLGIVLAWSGLHALRLDELAVVAPVVRETDPGLVTVVALLLFCGAAGKSGQIPLHVWLPDAMAGPTPVSALIHAATMVAAGIFLLCRVSMVMTVDALTVILWIGTATAFLAGLWAVAQRDIKKVLAYSTVSQLGYMVAAFALGTLHDLQGGGGHGTTTALLTAGTGVAAAMFHLMTHAFFKALLFLGAGSVIHAAHHEQDIFRLGGIGRRMPVTCATFTVGLLALIGTPFITAGFFSKDAILALAFDHRPVFLLLATGVLVTAFYMARLWGLVFLGAPRSEGAAHAHENGWVMTGPLVVLAVLSVIGGYGFFYEGLLGGAVAGVLSHETLPHPEGPAFAVILGVSLAGLAAAAVALAFYRRRPAEDRLEKALPPLHAFLARRLGFDEVYRFWIDRVQQPLAVALHTLEQLVIGIALVRGAAGLAALLGFGLRALHVGSVRAYAAWILGGALALAWILAT